jgi:hypothetical protein
MRILFKILLFVAAMWGGGAFAQIASYNTANGHLTIESLIVGDLRFKAVITIRDVLSANFGTAPDFDSFDQATGIVTLSRVLVGLTSYTNVKLTPRDVVSVVQLGTAPTPEAPKIVLGQNVAKLTAGKFVDIPVKVVNSTLPFSVAVSSGASCANVVTASDKITVTANSNAPCVQVLTVKVGTVTKPLTINVYDPRTMDIGEGLLISYVDAFTFKWNSYHQGGAFGGQMWSPKTTDGWHPISFFVERNWDDISSAAIRNTRHRSAIVIKDTSPKQDLLVPPTSYTRIWNNWQGGGDYAGTVWRLNCPTGYVALGSEVNIGWDIEPNKNATDAVWCVAKRFTIRGEQGPLAFSGWGSGDYYPLEIFKTVFPESSRQELGNFGVIDGSSFVGCPLWNCKGSGSVENPPVYLLKYPLTVAEGGDDGDVEPKLTDFRPLDNSGNRFSSTIRVPYTQIPSLNSQCANTYYSPPASAEVQAVCGDSNRYLNAFQNSPFYYMRRSETYESVGFFDNSQNAEKHVMGPFTVTNSFEQTKATSFEHSIGVSVAVEVGTGEKSPVQAKITATYTEGWKWGEEESKTYGTSSSSTTQFSVDPGTAGQVIQIQTQFEAFSEQGGRIGTPLQIGKKNSEYQKYLRFPLK